MRCAVERPAPGHSASAQTSARHAHDRPGLPGYGVRSKEMRPYRYPHKVWRNTRPCPARAICPSLSTNCGGKGREGVTMHTGAGQGEGDPGWGEGPDVHLLLALQVKRLTSNPATNTSETWGERGTKWVAAARLHAAIAHEGCRERPQRTHVFSAAAHRAACFAQPHLLCNRRHWCGSWHNIGNSVGATTEKDRGMQTRTTGHMRIDHRGHPN
jgi:hypothetical protein